MALASPARWQGGAALRARDPPEGPRLLRQPQESPGACAAHPGGRAGFPRAARPHEGRADAHHLAVAHAAARSRAGVRVLALPRDRPARRRRAHAAGARDPLAGHAGGVALRPSPRDVEPPRGDVRRLAPGARPLPALLRPPRRVAPRGVALGVLQPPERARVPPRVRSHRKSPRPRADAQRERRAGAEARRPGVPVALPHAPLPVAVRGRREGRGELPPHGRRRLPRHERPSLRRARAHRVPAPARGDPPRRQLRARAPEDTCRPHARSLRVAPRRGPSPPRHQVHAGRRRGEPPPRDAARVRARFRAARGRDQRGRPRQRDPHRGEPPPRAAERHPVPREDAGDAARRARRLR